MMHSPVVQSKSIPMKRKFFTNPIRHQHHSTQVPCLSAGQLSGRFDNRYVRMIKSLFLLFIFCLIVTESPAQKINRHRMMKETQNELPSWLNKIPGGNESNYGFSNRDEFSQAILGKPYQVFTLSDEFFKGELRPGQSYLKATGEWRIPIMVNRENRVLVTIFKKNKHWKIVELGARGLSHELQEFEQYPELSGATFLHLLRVYQLQSDFLFAGDPSLSSAEIILYPMHSATMNISRIRELSKTKTGLNEVLPFIKESIR